MIEESKKLGKTTKYEVIMKEAYPTKGVLYHALGNKSYVKQAEFSVQSIKKYTKSLKFCVCTDQDVTLSLWDNVIHQEKQKVMFDQYMLDKMFTIAKSSYEYTLYLDSDTYAMDDISGVFSLLEKYDIGVTFEHCRVERHEMMTGKRTNLQGSRKNVLRYPIPYSFGVMQGGFLLYKMSDKIKYFCKELKRLYQEKKYFDDEASLRELLWTTDLKFCVLPEEYNFFNVDMLKVWLKDPRMAKPKIFHYTTHKHCDVKQVINRVQRQVLREQRIDSYLMSSKKWVEKIFKTHN